jgi:hypothetical protein
VWKSTFVLLDKREEDCGHRPAQAKSENLSKNCPKTKKAGGVAEMIECLPISHKGLHSNHSNAKKMKHQILISATNLKKYTAAMK